MKKAVRIRKRNYKNLYKGRNALQIIIKIFIAIIGILAIGSLIYLYVNRTDRVVEEEVSDFNMPRVTFFYGNDRINEMSGTYTKPAASAVGDYVCLISNNRLYMAVSSETKPSKISYKITSLDSKTVYQDGEIKYGNVENTGNKDVADDEKVCSFEVDPWDSSDAKDYSEAEAKLTLTMKVGGENVYYVVRISQIEDAHLDYELKLARKFSNSTTDTAKLNKYETYLETDSNYATDSMDDVNLSSAVNYIGWEGADPERITKTKYYVTQIGEKSSKFKAMYRIKLTVNNKEQQYLVCENLETMFKDESTQWILDYKRDISREIKSTDKLVDVKYLDFGLGEFDDSSDSYAVSDNEKYVAYATGGALWEYDKSTGIMTRIYPFMSEAKSTDQITNSRKIKIIDISKKGAVTFAVIGTCLYGDDAGKNGATVYYYEGADSKRVYQDTFVESALSQADMEKTLVPYVSNFHGKGLTYYVSGKELLCDDNGKITELGQSNNEESFAISDDLKYIAYNTSDGIEIWNLDKEDNYEVHAPDGASLNVIGFAGDNVAYGVSYKKDAGKDASGKTVKPYEEIVICDFTGDEIESYKSEKTLYVSDGVKDGNVSMVIVTKDEDGVYTRGETKYITSQTKAGKSSVLPGYYIDDTYGICNVLKFSKKLKKITYRTVNFVSEMK